MTTRIFRISLVDYGDTKDLKFFFGKWRQFSFRWYREDMPFWNKYSWGYRPLCFSALRTHIPQRFAFDLWRLSLVFENYNYGVKGHDMNRCNSS